MKNCLFLIFFLLAYSNVLWSQAVNDDAVKKIQQLLEKAKETTKSDLPATWQYVQEAKQLAIQNHLDGLAAQAWYAESGYRFYKGAYKEMIVACTLAAELFEKENDKLNISKCYSRIGIAQSFLNQYQAGLDAFYKSLALAEQVRDTSAISAVNQNIANVYEGLKDWENALRYARKSLDLKILKNDRRGIASSYDNIGNIYYGQKKYAEANSYFHKALKVNPDSNDNAGIAMTLCNMGNSFMEMGNADSAIYYNALALDRMKDRPESFQRLWCQIVSNLACSWFRKGDMSKTELYINKCKSCEAAISDITFQVNLFQLKADYYKKKGLYALSVQYFEKAQEARDSIYIKSQNLENQKIAIRYEFNQKAKEDSLQYQLKISGQQMATTSYRNRMYLLLVALLIITGIAVAIVRRVRAMQERRRQAELETMRHNIAGDLHDDIGSTLSSIQIISSIAASQCAGNLPLQQSIKQINELSDKVASGMREIVWSVNPLNDNLEAIIMQLRKLAADILGPAGIPFVFIKNLTAPETELLPQTRKDLILFFKEALNNARKYSGATQVDIDIQQGAASLRLSIKDYGCGFDMETVCKGNGLNSMQRRADEMKATLSFCTKKDEGTKITLLLPLP